MNSSAYRLTRATRSGSSANTLFFGLITAAFAIAGFFAYMIVCWPCALLAAIAAVLSEPKVQLTSYCEACGNDVAPTSKRCPHCHTDLLAPPARRKPISPILLGTLIFAALIAGFFLWLHLRQ